MGKYFNDRMKIFLVWVFGFLVVFGFLNVASGIYIGGLGGISIGGLIGGGIGGGIGSVSQRDIFSEGELPNEGLDETGQYRMKWNQRVGDDGSCDWTSERHEGKKWFEFKDVSLRVYDPFNRVVYEQKGSGFRIESGDPGLADVFSFDLFSDYSEIEDSEIKRVIGAATPSSLCKLGGNFRMVRRGVREQWMECIKIIGRGGRDVMDQSFHIVEEVTYVTCKNTADLIDSAMIPDSWTDDNLVLYCNDAGKIAEDVKSYTGGFGFVTDKINDYKVCFLKNLDVAGLNNTIVYGYEIGDVFMENEAVGYDPESRSGGIIGDLGLDWVEGDEFVDEFGRSYYFSYDPATRFYVLKSFDGVLDTELDEVFSMPYDFGLSRVALFRHFSNGKSVYGYEAPVMTQISEGKTLNPVYKILFLREGILGTVDNSSFFGFFDFDQEKCFLMLSSYGAQKEREGKRSIGVGDGVFCLNERVDLFSVDFGTYGVEYSGNHSDIFINSKKLDSAFGDGFGFNLFKNVILGLEEGEVVEVEEKETKITEFILDGVTYGLGDWVPVFDYSYTQNDPDKNWGTLQKQQFSFPVDVCSVRVDAGFNDGGFVALFDGDERVGLVSGHTSFDSSLSSSFVIRNQDNELHEFPCTKVLTKNEFRIKTKSPYINVTDGNLYWCGFLPKQASGEEMEVFDVEYGRGDVLDVYSVHSIGIGEDGHWYRIYGEMC